MSENKNINPEENSLESNDILSDVSKALEESNNNEDINKEENQEEDKIIFDINIKSIDDLLDILLKNEYDFLVVEPSEDYVKISFKKDSILKEKKYIKYPIYSSILIKSKTISNLDIEKNDIEQKGTGKHTLDKKELELIIKTVPSNNGEQIYLKAKENKVENSKKNPQKVAKKGISAKAAFGFLASTLFIALVLGGGFITFIVFNAKTVEDISFFYNLGINLNQINNFLLTSTTIVFSVLVFIQTVFLIIFLFKALLTKKQFKRKKRIAIVLSIFFFVSTFGTGMTWMSVDKAIRALPNWQELSYGNIQLYDNNLLINKNFSKDDALIRNYTNIIGPATIKFDLSYYQRDEARKGFNIEKYIWNFGQLGIVETLNPEIIKEFDKKGNYEIKLTVEGTDRTGKFVSKEVKDTPKLSIGYLVNIEQKEVSNGGKIIEFDASDLGILGEVEWYLNGDFSTPAYVGENFKPSKIYYDEEIIGLQVKNTSSNAKPINKIIVVSGNTSDIKGKIESEVSIDNDLEYTLMAKDIQNDFGDGFIEKFTWIIEGKENVINADPTNLEESSKIKHIFGSYGTQSVKLIMSNSSGESKEIEKKLEIPKNVALNKQITITNNGKKIEDIKYDRKTKEYFLYDIGIPTKLSIDASTIRPDNYLYYIDSIKWDIIQNNNNTQKVGNKIEYVIDVEGNIEIKVNYTLKHRRNEEELINIVEKIYITPSKKDVILDLKVNSDSEYAPAIVSFDASLSQIAGENIVKFIYDYGDGTKPEERDAKNYGRRYLSAGTYDIKLTVVTETGKEYSIFKNLVLKPKPQKASITVSLKKAPVGQEINFFSTSSQGQITGYHWDFGDGNSSNEANPSYAYKTPGKYTAKLTLDFTNNNILTQEIDIEVTE